MGRLLGRQNDSGREKCGRGHNPDRFSHWVAGGGFKRGHARGETAERGRHAVKGSSIITTGAPPSAAASASTMPSQAPPQRAHRRAHRRASRERDHKNPRATTLRKNPVIKNVSRVGRIRLVRADECGLPAGSRHPRRRSGGSASNTLCTPTPNRRERLLALLPRFHGKGSFT